MALTFSASRARYIVGWYDAAGKRRSKTLWKDASQEDAQQYHDRLVSFAAGPMRALRGYLELAIDAECEHGRIYAIKNQMLPGIYKIGKTSGPIHIRLAAFNTAHPVDWTVERVARVTHMSAFERALHLHFSAERVNPNREFFKLDKAIVDLAFNTCVEIGDAEIRAKDLHRD